ncbi:MAG: hypothetical protein EZS28_038566 [Streblomastix strix]|uniref:Uncharacterized protein n=1 Tax=Streblomastix strix TaxID=222440 RepID=A0A5J4U5M8_9EUKA|nr:MAG: hypothetical protein EZS28_038566 [Streblomastix strix]
MQIKSGLDAINLRNLQKSSEIPFGVLIPRCLIMFINVITAEENEKKRLQTQVKIVKTTKKFFEAYENKVMVAFTTKSEQPKVQPQQRRQSRMSVGMKNHQNSVYSINGPKKRMSIFQQIHPDQRTFIYNLFPWMRNMRQKFYQQYYYLDIQVKNYLLEMYKVVVLYKQRCYEVVYAVNKPISQSKKWVDYFLRAVDNEIMIITDTRRFDQQELLAEIKNEGSDSQQGSYILFEGTLRTGQFKTGTSTLRAELMVQKPKSSMKLLPLLTNNYLNIPQPTQVTFDHQQTQQNQNVSPLTTLLQQMSLTASRLNQQSDTRSINSMQSQTALFLPFQKQRTFNQPISNLTPNQIKINQETHNIILTAEEKKKEIIRRRRMKFDEAKPQLSIGDVVDLIIARKNQICRSGGNDEGSLLESLRAKDYILLKLGKKFFVEKQSEKIKKKERKNKEAQQRKEEEAYKKK